MRQKKMIIVALAAMLLAIPAMVQSKKGETSKAKTLEVSFDYQRQAGPGSHLLRHLLNQGQGGRH